MNRHHRLSRRFFSLVELLIAMAILVLMMSFLLQFTNSARRIYAASNRYATTFEAGNILFQYLDRDLKNMTFRDRESNPDQEIPIYYKKSSDDCYLAFVTSTRCLHRSSNDFAGVGAYLVVYRFKKDTGKDTGTVERYVLDKTVTSGGDTRKPYWFIGIDLKQDVSPSIDDQFKSFCKDLMNTKEDVWGDVLARDVHDLDFTFLPDDDEGFRDPAIRAVRFSLSLKANPNGDDDEANRRVFSKLVFLPFPRNI